MTEKSNDAEAPKKKARSKASKAGKARGGKRRGSGRPAFRPSIEQRQTVEEMKFCGDSDEVIARALRIDVATLTKHFNNELQDGYASRRKEVVTLMFREARAGNASAIRRLEEIGRVANSVASAGDDNKPAAAAKPKPGKKELQQAAASAVSGIFTTPPAPKLVAANGQLVAGGA